MASPRFSVVIKRNCSMSPAGLAKVFAALALIVLAIGTGFAFMGAWLVLPFAGLEVLLLGAAYLCYARHAADYERIELGENRLKVEVADGDCSRSFELDARRARVRVENDARLVLDGGPQELEIGRHLDAEKRVALAAELARKLKV